MEAEHIKTIGKRIKEARQKLGLTQEKLGERADLHYSYIGQVERGNKTPSIKTLRKIAAALNTRVDSLLEEAPEYEISSQEILVRELVNMVSDCNPEDLKLFIDIIKRIKERMG